MSKSKSLHTLIHRMSKSEKRSFKLYVKILEGEKSYMDIYNYWELQEEWTREKEQTLRRMMPKKGQLHERTNYLFNLILKAIRQSQEENVRTKGLNDAYKMGILTGKKMYKEAYRLMLSTKKYMLQYELFEDLINLLYYEPLLTAKITPKTYANVIKQNFEEREQNLERLKDINSLNNIYNQILTILRTDKYEVLYKKLERLHEQKIKVLSFDDSKLNSTRVSMLYFLCLIRIHNSSREWNYKFELSQKLVMLFEEHTHFKQVNFGVYIEAQLDLLDAALRIENWKVFEATYQKVDTLRKEQPSNHNLLKKTLWPTYQYYKYLQKDHDTLKHLLNEQISIFKNMEEYLSCESKVGIYQYLIMICFDLKNFQELRKQFNLLKDCNCKNYQREVHLFTELILLLTEYEEFGASEQLKLQAKRMYINLGKHRAFYSYEVVVINFFKKLNVKKVEDQSWLAGYFEKTIAQFDVLNQDDSIRPIVDDFDFEEWFREKLSDIS